MKDKALIISIKVRQWSGRKMDRKITDEVNTNHGTRDAGRFNKILVDKSEIQKIQKLASGIRRFMYHNTLPWGDNGDRVLPSTNYFPFVQGLKPLKDEFEQATDDFCANYQTLIDNAKVKLNGMFNANDYPSAADMRSRFEVRVSMQPMPDADDFRFELVSDDELNKIRAEVGLTISNRHADAVQSLVKRCKEATSKIVGAVTRLNSKVEGGSKVFFHTSLMDNIKDIVDIIPALNYTNNPDVEQMRLAMQRMITDPDTLKSDPNVRDAYLDRASHLEQMFF